MNWICRLGRYLMGVSFKVYFTSKLIDHLMSDPPCRNTVRNMYTQK